MTEAADLNAWMEATAQLATAVAPRKESYFGIRPDGRRFTEARPVKSNTQWGNTHVAATVQYQVGHVATTTSARGDIAVVLQDATISHKPSPHSLLQAWLETSWRSCLNLEQLVIPNSSQAVLLILTIHIWNDDGNLRDACWMAGQQALNTTLLPSWVVQDNHVYIDDSVPPTTKLQVPQCFGCTMGVISMDDNDTVLIMDPAKDERVDGSITVLCTDQEILSIQSIGAPLTQSIIVQALESARQRSRELAQRMIISHQ